MENLFECDAPCGRSQKHSLINVRLIIYTQGLLVWVEAGLFALCAGMSLAFQW